jgi:hypothetical protein
VRGFLKVFDLYVKYNIHVSLAVLALVQITAMDFGIELSLGHQFIFLLRHFWVIISSSFIFFSSIKLHLRLSNIFYSRAICHSA